MGKQAKPLPNEVVEREVIQAVMSLKGRLVLS